MPTTTVTKTLTDALRIIMQRHCFQYASGTRPGLILTPTGSRSAAVSYQLTNAADPTAQEIASKVLDRFSRYVQLEVPGAALTRWTSSYLLVQLPKGDG